MANIYCAGANSGSKLTEAQTSAKRDILRVHNVLDNAHQTIKNGLFISVSWPRPCLIRTYSSERSKERHYIAIGIHEYLAILLNSMFHTNKEKMNQCLKMLRLYLLSANMRT